MEQINAIRTSLADAADSTAREMSEARQEGGFDFGKIWRDRSEHLRKAPANEIAPPIDRMRGDMDGRLWLRLFSPGNSRERWQVWDLMEPSPEFRLVLAEGEVFLDAAGDRVLVGRRDEFDVDHLVVKEIER